MNGLVVGVDRSSSVPRLAASELCGSKCNHTSDEVHLIQDGVSLRCRYRFLLRAHSWRASIIGHMANNTSAPGHTGSNAENPLRKTR